MRTCCPPMSPTVSRRKLAAYSQANGAQVVVVTLPTLKGYPIEYYGYQLGRHWGIGQKGKNNGVLLIVDAGERQMRIEVGYGLEGTLTDAQSFQIIHNVITPRFRKGDYAGGITAGADAILAVLGGHSQAVEQQQVRERGGNRVPHVSDPDLRLPAAVAGDAGRRQGRSPAAWEAAGWAGSCSGCSAEVRPRRRLRGRRFQRRRWFRGVLRRWRILRRRRRLGRLVRMVRFSADDKARITAAIFAAEKNTSGEFVAVVAHASDHYVFLPLLWSAILALLFPGACLLAGLSLPWVQIYHPTADLHRAGSPAPVRAGPAPQARSPRA